MQGQNPWTTVMALKNLFRSARGPLLPAADTVNREGAPAYRLTPQHALAQLVSTACMAGTFYASAQEQIETLLRLAAGVEPDFLAKAAVHARRRGRMKDAPAVLLAVLSRRAPDLFVKAFPLVVTDGRMLRTFVQVMRSGQVGRKSLGSCPKRLVAQWLEARSDDEVFRASVGTSPSLADVVRMVHPKPASPSRTALFGWLLGREHDASALPPLVSAFEAWKRDRAQDPPDVPFLMLTSRPLDAATWATIARRASWQTLRMNLNTIARHGAFEADPALDAHVASRLADRAEVLRSRAYPYQILAAWKALDASVPASIGAALEDALEASIENVPSFGCRVRVAVDVSGSMTSPVTGERGSGTTSVTCRDVAALFASAILRKNPTASVLPFHDVVVEGVRLNPRDTVTTNAKTLASLPSGGTNCSAPLAAWNRAKDKADLVIYLSDNQSWVDTTAGRGPALLEQWRVFRGRTPAARLVCIDLQPYGTSQAPEAHDVLNVGGFSDSVFDLVGEFSHGGLAPEPWVAAIETIAL
jgi:60 kDa SS-A/Ro ribonucleoprotein